MKNKSIKYTLFATIIISIIGIFYYWNRILISYKIAIMNSTILLYLFETIISLLPIYLLLFFIYSFAKQKTEQYFIGIILVLTAIPIILIMFYTGTGFLPAMVSWILAIIVSLYYIWKK